eukprot:gnl/MRDRNA2_/MRDRNA2_229492_c0_seq1.p1 gnl/MRDRNA2_/MRDRNA2_229492_c0~~gnl/MRDRNA2_/MRDRNA2_229492_c0_seq1.p1  ORF type:complete len:569 (-),score=93.45 gnl/MRDRNA2_/MRDRNA2_229492_c0_seq1:27-1586(-)
MRRSVKGGFSSLIGISTGVAAVVTFIFLVKYLAMLPTLSIAAQEAVKKLEDAKDAFERADERVFNAMPRKDEIMCESKRIQCLMTAMSTPQFLVHTIVNRYPDLRDDFARTLADVSPDLNRNVQRISMEEREKIFEDLCGVCESSLTGITNNEQKRKTLVEHWQELAEFVEKVYNYRDSTQYAAAKDMVSKWEHFVIFLRSFSETIVGSGLLGALIAFAITLRQLFVIQKQFYEQWYDINAGIKSLAPQSTSKNRKWRMSAGRFEAETWDKYRDHFFVENVPMLVGITLSTSLVGFAVWTLVITFVLFCLINVGSMDFNFMDILNSSAMDFVILKLVQEFIKKFVIRKFASIHGLILSWPILYSWWSGLSMCLAVITGIVAGAVRAVFLGTISLANIFAFHKTEVPPTWSIPGSGPLAIYIDPAYFCFYSLLSMKHRHVNAFWSAFAVSHHLDMIQKAKNSPKSPSSSHDRTHIVRHRWRQALFLSQNPSMLKWRAHHIQDSESANTWASVVGRVEGLE